MKLVFIFALFLFTTNSMAAVNQNKGELISMAVGEVTGHVVTSREVNINYFIERVLFARKGKRVPKKFHATGSKEFSKEVTAVLIEWVVFLESKDFKSTKVKSSELKTAVANFNKTAVKNKLWKSLKVSSSEISNIIERKLQSKKFIKFKVTSSEVPITDDEAKVYFQENRVQFGNLPFSNFKDNIKAFLSRKQVDRRLKDWFEVLQTKYRVRNFLTEF